MTSIYFFQKSLLIESEKSLDISLKTILWDTLSNLVEKMYLAANSSQFQTSMCQIFGPSDQVKSLQESWMARDFSILSGICIISGQRFDSLYTDEQSAFSQIQLAEDFILSYKDDLNKLMIFILQALSHRINVQIFGGNSLEENRQSFFNLVLSQEPESPLVPSQIDTHKPSNQESDREPDSNIHLENFPEEVTPSFVKVNGEIQWRDSCGNLHPLPIE